MTTIVIPKEIAQSGALIAVPKDTYKQFIAWQKRIKSLNSFVPSKIDLADLKRARRDFKLGRYVEWR